MQNDDLTSTTDLDKEQQKMFREMLDAESVNDTVRATKAHNRIKEIEDEQHKAHAEARAYYLKKLQKGKNG